MGLRSAAATAWLIGGCGLGHPDADPCWPRCGWPPAMPTPLSAVARLHVVRAPGGLEWDEGSAVSAECLAEPDGTAWLVRLRVGVDGGIRPSEIRLAGAILDVHADGQPLLDVPGSASLSPVYQDGTVWRMDVSLSWAMPWDRAVGLGVSGDATVRGCVVRLL